MLLPALLTMILHRKYVHADFSRLSSISAHSEHIQWYVMWIVNLHADIVPLWGYDSHACFRLMFSFVSPPSSSCLPGHSGLVIPVWEKLTEAFHLTSSNTFLFRVSIWVPEFVYFLTNTLFVIELGNNFCFFSISSTVFFCFFLLCFCSFHILKSSLFTFLYLSKVVWLPWLLYLVHNKSLSAFTVICLSILSISLIPSTIHVRYPSTDWLLRYKYIKTSSDFLSFSGYSTSHSTHYPQQKVGSVQYNLLDYTSSSQLPQLQARYIKAHRPVQV